MRSKIPLSTFLAERREDLTPPEFSHKRKATLVQWSFWKNKDIEHEETAEEESASSWDFKMTVHVSGAEWGNSTQLKIRTIFTCLKDRGRRSPNLQKSARNPENGALNIIHPKSAHMQPIIRWYHEIFDKFQHSRETQFDARFLESANFAFQSASQSFAENRLERFFMKVVGLKTGRPYKMSSDHMSHVTRSQYESLRKAEMQFQAAPDQHRAHIALGSNVGDRVGNIESACRMMGHHGIKVTRTSALYETNPMYYENQRMFINGVCEVSARRPTQHLNCSQRWNTGRDFPRACTATTAASTDRSRARKDQNRAKWPSHY